jgi:hypothetical protein
MSAGDCLHGGRHCKPNNCPDCGRFCSDSWTTGYYYTQNGGNEDWGGHCKVHGEWSESAA